MTSLKLLLDKLGFHKKSQVFCSAQYQAALTQSKKYTKYEKLFLIMTGVSFFSFLAVACQCLIVQMKIPMSTPMFIFVTVFLNALITTSPLVVYAYKFHGPLEKQNNLINELDNQFKHQILDHISKRENLISLFKAFEENSDLKQKFDLPLIFDYIEKSMIQWNEYKNAGDKKNIAGAENDIASSLGTLFQRFTDYENSKNPKAQFSLIAHEAKIKENYIQAMNEHDSTELLFSTHLPLRVNARS